VEPSEDIGCLATGLIPPFTKKNPKRMQEQSAMAYNQKRKWGKRQK
jgi:hypothetical protein